MKYFIIALGLIALLQIMKHHAPSKKILDTHATVLAAGDSLTHGFGAPEGTSYPDILSQRLHRTVINAGINGELSEEGLKRLPSLLKQYQPALTVICYGGNDILQKCSMIELKENLKKMIRLAQLYQSDVLLISVPNLTLFGLEPLALYEEVSRETDVPLVSDVLSDILEDPSLKSDQIHPNAKGYHKMADAIYEKIKTIYSLP